MFLRNGTLDVFISDHLLLDYMRFKQTECNLQIGRDFGSIGFALGLAKTLSSEEKVHKI